MKCLPFLLAILTVAAKPAHAQFEKAVYTIVEQRQKNCGADQNTISCDSARKRYRQQYDSVARANFSPADYKGLQIGNLTCPKTSYESLIERKRCDFLQASANTILSEYHVDTSKVFFSMIPDNCLNAMTTPMADFQPDLDGNWLVEFNVGFSIYCHKLSLLCGDMVPSSGDEDSLDLDANHYYAKLKDPGSDHLYLSLGAFLLADLCGEPNIQSDSILLEKGHEKIMVASLSDGINTFTLCHELAHIILNHAGEIHQLRKDGSTGTSELAVVKYKRESEFQADSLGLVLFKEVEEKNKNYTGRTEFKTVEAPFRYAPLVFFTWLGVIQQFELTFTHHFRGMETYPTADERRERLLRVYRRLHLYDENKLNVADLLDGSIRLTYDVVKQFYDSNDASIKALANRPSNYCPIQ